MSITLIVTLVARPDSIAEIAKTLEEVKVYLPKVDGCESVRICRGLDDPALFTLIESWSARDKHDTYQRGVSRDWSMNSLRLFFAVLAVLLAKPASSDELRPGYLEMRQTSPGGYNLLFKIPARGEDLRLAIYVKLPECTQDVGPPPCVV